MALANKTARIAWKLMTSGERYDPAHRPTREGPDASQGGGLRAEPLAPAAGETLCRLRIFSVTAFVAAR